MSGTLTVNWSLSVAGQWVWWQSFTGAADITSPFDTNASNFVTLVGTAGNMPVTMTAMQPNAPDERVAPLVASVAVNGNMAKAPLLQPDGYFGIGGGGGGIGAIGSHVMNLVKRSVAFDTIPINQSSPGPEPTSVFLTLDDVQVRTIPTPPCQIFLDWSDDRAHSFGSPVGQPMGALGEYRTFVQWQRLGYARDRVWRLSWSCPRPTALQGA